MHNKKHLPVFQIMMLVLIWSQCLAGNIPHLPAITDLPGGGAGAAVMQEGGNGTKPPRVAAPDTPPEAPVQSPKTPAAQDTLEPFKPSEEIEADQAVDFPYDI